MPTVTYTQFQPWHLKLFEPGHLYDRPELDPETRAAIYRQVDGVTLLLDGQIAAILGVVPIWPGVAEVTMIPSDLFYRHIKLCLRECKSLLRVAMDTYKLHRMHATALASQPKHGRFLTALGFVYEGTLVKWGPAQESFEMYRWEGLDG